MGWLNVGSFLLGLIAWILPVVNLIRLNKTNQHWVMLSLLSVTSCAISLCFQVIYHNYLVIIEDWSALLDITPFIAFTSCVLLIVTLILNIVTFIVYRVRD